MDGILAYIPEARSQPAFTEFVGKVQVMTNAYQNTSKELRLFLVYLGLPSYSDFSNKTIENLNKANRMFLNFMRGSHPNLQTGNSDLGSKFATAAIAFYNEKSRAVRQARMFAQFASLVPSQDGSADESTFLRSI